MERFAKTRKAFLENLVDLKSGTTAAWTGNSLGYATVGMSKCLIRTVKVFNVLKWLHRRFMICRRTNIAFGIFSNLPCGILYIQVVIICHSC